MPDRDRWGILVTREVPSLARLIAAAAVGAVGFAAAMVAPLPGVLALVVSVCLAVPVRARGYRV